MLEAITQTKGYFRSSRNFVNDSIIKSVHTKEDYCHVIGSSKSLKPLEVLTLSFWYLNSFII